MSGTEPRREKMKPYVDVCLSVKPDLWDVRAFGPGGFMTVWAWVDKEEALLKARALSYTLGIEIRDNEA
jgi:hypothetical protein